VGDAGQRTVEAPLSHSGAAAFHLSAGPAGTRPVLAPLAGVGTPPVTEDAVAALGAALRIPYRSALLLVGDVVELYYRLPRLWGLVQGGFLQAWKARQVARATMTLPVEVTSFVDAQAAVTAGRNQLPAVNPLVHEALLRCAPDLAQAREQEALEARDVAFHYGRATATCAVATMTATLDTLDAMDLDATVSDPAEAMGRLGDASALGVRRSHALGMLASPQRTLDVFGPIGRPSLAGAAGWSGGRPDDPCPAVADGFHEALTDAVPPPGGDGADRSAATDGSAWDALDGVTDSRGMRSDGLLATAAGASASGPGRALPRTCPSGHAWSATGSTAVLHLHVTAADLSAAGAGVGGGRVEKLGAATLDLLRDWLQRTSKVTVRPVLDLSRDVAVHRHDPPDPIRESVVLRDGHCVFPGCSVDARRCDLDHIEPYVDPDQGGPPGQTSTRNLACLCRRHHRLKTFTAWTYRRLPGGDYLWTSPYGSTHQVTPDPQT
jgi:hypothetical protein